MADHEQTPALQGQIRWHHYNYPPFLKVIHFVPKQLPRHKKFIVMSLFIIHLTIVINSLLNFVDSCFQGGLRVLYAILFIFFINPLVLFVFDKGFTGLCKDKSNLKWFIIGQPILSVFFIIISIVNVFGFNGFIRVSQLFNEGHGFAGVIAVIISIVFLGVGLFSGFIYVRVMRERGDLTSDL